jgi:hypothetical protein
VSQQRCRTIHRNPRVKAGGSASSALNSSAETLFVTEEYYSVPVETPGRFFAFEVGAFGLKDLPNSTGYYTKVYVDVFGEHTQSAPTLFVHGMELWHGCRI